MIGGRLGHRAIVAKARREARERETRARLKVCAVEADRAGYERHRDEVTRFVRTVKGERSVSIGEDPKRPYIEVGIPDGSLARRVVRFNLVMRGLVHEVEQRGHDHGWNAGDGGGGPRYLMTWIEWEPAGYKVERIGTVGSTNELHAAVRHARHTS